MTIKVTVNEVLTAFPALQRIAKEKMPPKAAYRLGRLLEKLRSEVRDFEKQQMRIVMENGGEMQGESVVLYKPTDDASAEDKAKYEANFRAITQSVDQIIEEVIDIEAELIPMSIFESSGSQESLFTPEDFSLIIPFVKDE